MGMRKTIVTLATLALFVVAAGAAAMPKSAGASGTLEMSSGAARLAALEPAKGDGVTLTASYSGLRKQDTVRVQLLCYQDIGVVYGDAVTLTGTPQTVSFTLGANSATATSIWDGGNAHCVGYLFYITNVGGGNTQQLASVAFDATG
jgi:hypothetical protein